MVVVAVVMVVCVCVFVCVCVCVFVSVCVCVSDKYNNVPVNLLDCRLRLLCLASSYQAAEVKRHLYHHSGDIYATIIIHVLRIRMFTFLRIFTLISHGKYVGHSLFPDAHLKKSHHRSLTSSLSSSVHFNIQFFEMNKPALKNSCAKGTTRSDSRI